MKTIFPHGFCPFYPSCSEYMRQAVMKDGIFFGSAKGVYRILRCHPFTKGGADLP